MGNYKVKAVPWEHGFDLHITGPDDFTGCTQALSNGDILPLAKDYISLNTGEASDEIGVTLSYNMQPETETPVAD
jgi:hypothetical protein